MRRSSDLRRRLNDLLAALDPTAPPPAGSRRTKAALAFARAQQDRHRAAVKMFQDCPELLDLADRLGRVPEASPEADELASRILAILAGEDLDQVVTE